MPDRPAFIAGPYASPVVHLGDEMTCAIYGRVEVKSWHETSVIAVPRGSSKGRRQAIIISDDLLRALQVEMSPTIEFYWGVSDGTVTRWRQALKINGRAVDGFRDAMSKVGSVNGPARANVVRLNSYIERPWSTDELALLPACSTLEVMAKTGRTLRAVERARARFGMPQTRNELLCRVCGYTWKAQHNRPPRRCPNHGCRQPLS